MVRELFADDIDGIDISTEREIEAAQTMLRLLEMFDPNIAISIALTRRGDMRIIRAEDSVFFYRLVVEFGIEDAWSAALLSGFFCHMDRPIMPNLSFDLNGMSDTDCISRFRFDHFGIQQLVVVLEIPPTIVVPGHRDRINHVEVICLILDRMAYPRKWADLSQRYGRHQSALSRIFKYLMHKLLEGI